jgi:glycosyltransferase involved in cell wall biosynthesis
MLLVIASTKRKPPTMTAETLPFVSVVIPTRNEERHIASCLRSVLEGTYPHDRLEILVVDGKSDDRTLEIVSDFASHHRCVSLLENPARIVPNAMNIGIRASRGDLIVRVDAHALYGRDYLMQLITWMTRLGADNVGGVFVALPGAATPEATAVAMILSNPFGVGNAQYRVNRLREPTEVDTVPFGCYRREIFERIGLYDEMFVRNQDDELNARLKKAGGRMFLIPEIRIEYFTRESLPKMALMLYQYGYFKPLVAMKLGRPATLRQLAPPAFTAMVVGLPALFWLLPITAVLWRVAVASHVGVNLVVSLRLSRRKGWRLFPFLFAGFAMAHLAYGAGYLRGVWDFAVLRRQFRAKRHDVPITR